MRGKGFTLKKTGCRHGITPACAGKRAGASLRRKATQDHPRVCGEKRRLNMLHTGGPGSPPRVRGKERKIVSYNVCRRITPACAGKSALLIKSAIPSKDHPRVCGEKLTLENHTTERGGSPPRVRGKELKQTDKQNRKGITPACAGKRCVDFSVFIWVGDHPRVCGEKA